MNCEQANSINIADFLLQRGYKPIKINGSSLWYNLREERTASLKVDTGINRWFDYGINQGGKLVDLVSIYFTNGDVKSAINYISTNTGNYTIITQHKRPEIFNYLSDTMKSKTEIIDVLPIHNEALLQYIKQRKIHEHYGLLKEIHYKANNNVYFALCWLNDSGGYEIRNKYFKGCLNGKDITTIQGSNNSIVCLFEGMFDYLTYRMTRQAKHKAIILNSLVNLERVIPIIRDCECVNVYFDNDNAGKEALKRLKEVREVQDRSMLYEGVKDYNEYLMRL